MSADKLEMTENHGPSHVSSSMPQAHDIMRSNEQSIDSQLGASPYPIAVERAFFSGHGPPASKPAGESESPPYLVPKSAG